MPTELVFAFIGLLVGLCIGAGIAWTIVWSRAGVAQALATSESHSKIATCSALYRESQNQLAAAKNECKVLRDHLKKYEGAWTAAQTKLQERERHILELKQSFDQSKGKLVETFKSLAGQALTWSNKSFLQLAEDKFKTLRNQASADLDSRKDAIDALVKPVSEAITAYQQETKNLEEKRVREISAVSEQLKFVALAQAQLNAETSRLVNALKTPSVRGRWGEIQLKKTAELAGMAPYCDFVEQEHTTSEDGALRPDMTVKLPAGREIVVDSKVPLGGFLEALEAVTDELKNAALDKHARQLVNHIDKLSAKEYWSQFQSSPEFVVLFIPNDSFLAAAAERNPSLIENALIKKVVIATPTTFIALLRAIEFGWRQQKAVENAVEITVLGQELSDRFATLVDHFSKVGSAIGKAVEAYNSAVTSFESRILPTARRFKTLGAGGRKEVDQMEAVSVSPRTTIGFSNDGQNS